MNNPKISVIVPVYNVEKYLPRCIESILNQSYSNLEIILVDDGSSDHSGEICDTYAMKDSRILSIHKRNGGPGSARNDALNVATGEYIGFVDSDDYIAKDMYEYLYGLVETESADVSMCGIIHCYSDKEEYQGSDYYEVTDSVGAIYRVLECKKVSVTLPNKLFHRHLFDNVRFLSLELAEDAEILVNILSQITKAVITDNPKYHYYHRQNSLTANKFNPQTFDVVLAYDKIYSQALTISPDLHDVALFRKCWSRIFVLDKMLQGKNPLYRRKEKEYIGFLRKYRKFLLRTDLIYRNRKIWLCILWISPSVCRLMIKFKNLFRKELYNA